MKKQPKVALVTDWLTSFGGEHRVLWALHELFPEAPIFTTIYAPDKLPMYKSAEVVTSFLDKPPFSWVSKKKHQLFLQAMPLAFEAFDLSEFDIVISSSHACSKGVITKVETLHICYCHSPMRYAWDNCHQYINENAPLKKIGGKYFAKKLMHKIRMWDRLAAERVDTYLCNSKYIEKRINKYYQRDAKVIYPPIETGRFKTAKKKEDFFLAGGRLVANKKMDIVIEAFNYLGLPLKIFGTGPEQRKLQSMANENIEFVGFVSDDEVADLFSKAKAYLVPQLEDFGIVTVEAMASGTPVVGYKKGGTGEIVTDGVTGVLMDEQSAPALIDAIERFQKKKFSPASIRKEALKYDVARFKRDIQKFIDTEYKDWKKAMTI